MIKSYVKKVLPETLKNRIIQYKSEVLKKQVLTLPLINEKDFECIIINSLGIESGDIVFVHSSVDKMNLGFPFYNIINVLQNIIGENGTLVFPAYNNIPSYEFLKSGSVFNIKKTPGFTGVLNEFARRKKGAIRSLHPTKSVVAIGKLAEELTKDHHLSPYSYDMCSPYYKIVTNNAKVIGIGVKTTYLSMVHAVDDYMKADFPVNPYHLELFHSRCIDYNNNEVIVDAYAHDMKKMNFSLPDYIHENIPDNICKDVQELKTDFFIADAKLLFDKMLELAKNGITIYSKKFYKPGY